jgi:MoxR-like ATPase
LRSQTAWFGQAMSELEARMGLFGFGGGDVAKIDRLKKKATNKYGQAIERTTAMRQLRQIGTPDALEALLERFMVNVDVTITDHDEKRELYEWLLEAGERAIGPIERFVATHDGVYWPLKALKEIAGLDRAVDGLLAALDRAETLSQRVNEQRVQLVSNLRDFPHPKTLARLKLLVHDKHDEVRLMALDGLMTYGEADAVSLVAERILDLEETPRVRHVLFEQLIDLQWSLGPWKEAIEAAGVLPTHYQLDAAGKVIRGFR